MNSGIKLRDWRRMSIIIGVALLHSCGTDTVLTNSSPEEPDREHDIAQRPTLTYEEELALGRREALLAEHNAKFMAYFYEEQSLLQRFDTLTEEEKQRYQEVHEATKQALDESLRARQSYTGALIGDALEGRHGELLLLKVAHPDYSIQVFRSKDGLELMRADAAGFQWFYAIVRDNGDVVITERYGSGFDVSRAPLVWTLVDADGSFSVPDSGAKLLTSSPRQPVRPPSTVGWLFPTRELGLVCIGPDVAPVEDVLWVVRNGDGFDIVHSGPEQSGIYAHVLADRTIKFATPLRGSNNTDWSDGMWMILDRQDKPAYDAAALHLHRLPERLELPYKTWINDKGGLSIQNTHRIVD